MDWLKYYTGPRILLGLVVALAIILGLAVGGFQPLANILHLRTTISYYVTLTAIRTMTIANMSTITVNHTVVIVVTSAVTSTIILNRTVTVVNTTTATTTIPIHNTTTITIVKTITITLTPNATRPIPYSCNITLFQLPNGTAWLIGVLLYPVLWTNENWSNPCSPLPLKLPGTSFVGVAQLPHGVEYVSLMPLWFNISIPSLQGGMYWVNYTWNGYHVYVFGTTTSFGGFKPPAWLLGADWLNGTFDCRIIHVNVTNPNIGLAYTYTGAQYWAWVRSIAEYGKPAPCYMPFEWTTGWWVYRVKATPNGTNWQYYCGPNGVWAGLKP